LLISKLSSIPSIASTKLMISIPNSERKVFAIAPTATLAAVSLALALSSTFLISSK